MIIIMVRKTKANVRGGEFFRREKKKKRRNSSGLTNQLHGKPLSLNDGKERWE